MCTCVCACRSLRPSWAPRSSLLMSGERLAHDLPMPCLLTKAVLGAKFVARPRSRPNPALRPLSTRTHTLRRCPKPPPSVPCLDRHHCHQHLQHHRPDPHTCARVEHALVWRLASPGRRRAPLSRRPWQRAKELVVLRHSPPSPPCGWRVIKATDTHMRPEDAPFPHLSCTFLATSRVAPPLFTPLAA